MPGFLDFFFGNAEPEPAELALDQGDLERLQLRLLQEGNRDGADRVRGVKQRQAERLGIERPSREVEQQLIAPAARQDPTLGDLFSAPAEARSRLLNALAQQPR